MSRDWFRANWLRVSQANIERNTNVADLPQSYSAAAEREPPIAFMEVHDLGCCCWPHVSQPEAIAAVEAVALAEYRDSLRRVPVPLDVERLARALLAIRENVNFPKRWQEADFRWLSRQLAAAYEKES